MSIPSGDVSGSTMDLGGANTENVYLGLSSLHYRTNYEKDDGNVINLSRHYFLLAVTINK